LPWQNVSPVFPLMIISLSSPAPFTPTIIMCETVKPGPHTWEACALPLCYTLSPKTEKFEIHICIESGSPSLNLTLEAIMLTAAVVWPSFENLTCFKTRNIIIILTEFQTRLLNYVPIHFTLCTHKSPVLRR
jgi:hypothetical protein